MPIVIMTPISNAKSYTFESYVRGVRQLDWPKEEIFWLFVVQQQGLKDLPARIQRLRDVVEDEYYGMEVVNYTLPFSDQFFDPRYSQNLSWKERAQIAGSMRAVGFEFVKEALPEATHVFSLGCDVVLNRPEDLAALLYLKVPIVSGILVARKQGFPLVLRYDNARWRELTDGGKKDVQTREFWSTWIDYPKDRPFQCDWAGMDILLVEKTVAESVNLWDYRLDEYGLGEDGWYCVKAEELTGQKLWFDPHVTPYHVDNGDIVMWAGGNAPRYGVISVCPYCSQRHEVQPNTYIDIQKICLRCGQPFYAQSWEQEDERVEGVQPTLVAWG